MPRRRRFAAAIPASPFIISATLALVALPVFALAGPPLFDSKWVGYSSTLYTSTISGADFNHDGRPDVVVGSGQVGLDSVVVHLGMPDERLDAGIRIALGSTSSYPLISAGRFDDDAHPDVVVMATDRLIWVRGHGDGSFDPPASLGVVGGSYDIPDLADFDHDGHVDVAVVLDDETSVLVLRGDGAGGSLGSVLVPSPARIFYSYAADIDANGTVDLIATSDSAVVFIGGNGDGSFEPAALVRTGSSLGGAVRSLGDVNEDGFLDLVFGIGTMLGNGDGTFDPPIPISIWPWGLADLNGDGHLDVFGKSTSGPTRMNVRLGNGDGTFGPLAGFAVPFETGGVVPADFTGDGRVDLAILGHSLRHVSILEGNGDGTLGSAQEFAAGSGALALAVGDVNGDGRVDAIVGNSAGVAVLLGAAGGSFGAPVGYAAPAPNAVLAPDLNGDGRADVVSLDPGTAHAWLAGPGGALGARVDLPLLGQGRDLATGDVNGDGKADLVAARLSGAGIAVWLGNGNGTFQPRIDVAGEYVSLALGDLNGDGKLDLVAASAIASVYVAFGNGAGGFAPPVSYPGGSNPPSFGRVALGDLDADGHLDVVGTTPGGPSVYVFRGSATGVLSSPAIYASPNTKHRIAFADFDQDGHLDFVVSRSAPNAVGVWYGNGDGTLRREDIHGTGGGSGTSTIAYGVATADVDGDGRSDILDISGEGKLVLLRNRGASSTSVVDAMGGLTLALTVRPNPARDHLRLNFAVPRSGVAHIDVLDLAGRRVRSVHSDGPAGVRQVVIARGGNFPSGMYFVRVRQGSGMATRRVVVIDQ